VIDIVGGFWAERRRVNRERTIPHGFSWLQRTSLRNLRGGGYQAGVDTSGARFPFLDSDVYKWLEAVGWDPSAAPDSADEAIGVVAAAQKPDGYVNSFFGGPRYEDLQWGHEFYCLGHLIQAAVAWHRGAGDNRLLDIAVRAADRLDKDFGPGGRDGIDGHPEIETALVDLTRVTGDRRYLELARRMIELRGRGLLGGGRFGSEYWQDHLPVREAPTVAGHVVRQLYLDCGAVDVAVETGDEALLNAVRRRWADLMATRTYLTGGMGSRHRDEAYGDPYELPPDRAYNETCAAIASVMLAQRLLLATGDTSYADAVERAVFNGVLSGSSLTGTEFFYTNPLQRRTRRAAEPEGHSTRRPWYPCACCPPNLMRLLASWDRYVATVSPQGVRIHQFADADIAGPAGARLRMRTAYPWDGKVTIHVDETPPEPWTLSLRVPGWCTTALLTMPGLAPVEVVSVSQTRVWRPGDTVVLDMAMPIRITLPHPRVDAVRGCLAVERGPLVYCLESADLPDGVELEDLVWDGTGRPVEVPRDDLAASLVGIELPLVSPSGELSACAVPYFAWANRTAGGMRVWIPRID
jgi:uncharacterized protein